MCCAVLCYIHLQILTNCQPLCALCDDTMAVYFALCYFSSIKLIFPTISIRADCSYEDSIVEQNDGIVQFSNESKSIRE